MYQGRNSSPTVVPGMLGGITHVLVSPLSCSSPTAGDNVGPEDLQCRKEASGGPKTNRSLHPALATPTVKLSDMVMPSNAKVTSSFRITLRATLNFRIV